MDLSLQEKKELQKVEAFKEHSIALQRHMDNTSNYLQKEVQSVEQKINEAKHLILSELGLNLYYLDSNESHATEKLQVEQELREVEEEEDSEEQQEQEEEYQESNDDDTHQHQHQEEEDEDDYGDAG